MLGDNSSKDPINPTDEFDKEKSSGKSEDNKSSSSKDKKKNDQYKKEEDELEITDDKMSFQEWKV
jgi:hypothetical protein